MPASKPPSSISRDKSYSVWPGNYFQDLAACSSILGKRERGLGEDLTKEPQAKRPVGGPGDTDCDIPIPRLDRSGSDEDEDEDEDEPEGLLELDSKTRSTKDARPPASIGTPHLSKGGSSAHNHPTASLERKHVFATRRILRRHSLPLPHTEDNRGPAAGEQHSERHGPEATYLSRPRRDGFPSVYRISCSEKASKYHPTILYEDDPAEAVFTDRRRSSHMSGNKPIYQLRDYVNQFQQSSFVIVKNRTCKNQMTLSYSRERHNEAIIILSNDLRQAIQKVATCPLECDNERRLGKDELLEMDAPYLFLYHHREPLRVYSQSSAAPLQTMIDAVLEYLDSNYAQEYTEATELISQGMITPYHVEKLYHPNQLLVDSSSLSDIGLEDQAVYVLSRWPLILRGRLTLFFWCWIFDGYSCYRDNTNLSFSMPTEDEAEPFPIDKLMIYPASFTDKESIELFRERGKAFWSLMRPNFVYYDDNGRGSRADSAKSGRYMIDFEMHQRLHPSHWNDQTIRNKQTDPWRLSFRRNDKPEEDEFLIMPTKLPGYDFLEKEWVNLSVSNIKSIRWNKQPYEDLVLPEGTKHLVKALVTIRASSIKKKKEDANFDIISGKGNGLIMLFHGSPGTGKTLTAESVAEIAEMPLYPITCGDIGTDPERVERYLQLVFQLGKRWNCVLLMDEADVFLEERTLTDLQRNSLVSVFLRMLEYYEGILILTSNRVGTFDDAFRSRIHIALHYEDLKPRSRKQIWLNFLSRLEDTEEGENVEGLRRRVDELAKHNLNGREIRNALSTARQLASYGGEKMGWEHLELAIKTVNDFGSYLRDVHGHSDHEWARETRTR